MSFASPVTLSVEESDLRAYFTPLPSAAATQWSVADHKVAAQRLAFVEMGISKLIDDVHHKKSTKGPRSLKYKLRSKHDDKRYYRKMLFWNGRGRGSFCTHPSTFKSVLEVRATRTRRRPTAPRAPSSVAQAVLLSDYDIKEGWNMYYNTDDREVARAVALVPSLSDAPTLTPQARRLRPRTAALPADAPS